MPVFKSPVPTAGINRDDDPTEFTDAFSPFMKNAVVERTRIRKRRGYSLLGTNLPLSGTGMELINYVDATGDTHLIAVTTTKAYEYSLSTGAWGEITPDAGDFNGDEDNRWSWCLATDTEEFPNNGGTALLISNGVDDVQAYEGDAGDKFAELAHLFPSFGSVKEIAEFWNHLFFINFNDGINRVKSAAYADTGNVDTWFSGNSNLHVLTDSIGKLLRAKKLGSVMVLYSDKSITICRYYGGSTIFAFPTVVYETGLLGAKCVYDFVNVHYILGTDQQIYAYSGGSTLTPILSQVNNTLFAELDVSRKNFVVSGIDQGRRSLYFWIPKSGEDFPKSAYTYRYQNPRRPCEYHEFADTVRDMSTFKNAFEWYCDDTNIKDLYCDEQTFYCDDSYGQLDYETAVILSHDGYVFVLDELTGTDNGASIEFEVQTPDFTDEEEVILRAKWFSFSAMAAVTGADLSVFYSTDTGKTWTEFEDSPVSLETAWKTHRLPLDAAGRRIRCKLWQSSSKDVQIRGKFKLSATRQSVRD